MIKLDRNTSILVFAAAMSAWCSQAFAHHSAAMFDSATQATVTGVVKSFQYTNPHAWLMIDSVSADGQKTSYSVELAAPTAIQRAGITKSTFVPGEKLVVKMHPLKDGRPAGEFVSAQKADGKVITMRMQQALPGAGGAAP